MNKDKYSEIIHSRLNHVQNLQSGVSGLVITVCGWLIGKNDYANIQLIHNLVIIYSVYGLLIWTHLFTMYQYFSVKKAAFVLANLEEQVSDYNGTKYFNMGSMRLYLYFLSHGAPSIIAFSAPLVAYALGAIELYIALQLFVFFIVFTVLIVWLLGRSFLTQ